MHLHEWTMHFCRFFFCRAIPMNTQYHKIILFFPSFFLYSVKICIFQSTPQIHTLYVRKLIVMFISSWKCAELDFLAINTLHCNITLYFYVRVRSFGCLNVKMTSVLWDLIILIILFISLSSRLINWMTRMHNWWCIGWEKGPMWCSVWPENHHQVHPKMLNRQITLRPFTFPIIMAIHSKTKPISSK